ILPSAVAVEGFGSYLYQGTQEQGEPAYFLLNGEASFNVRDGAVHMTPRLSLNLTHPNYTEANITHVRVILLRNGSVVTNTSIGSTVIPQYQIRTVSHTIRIPPLNTVDTMQIRAGFYAAPEDRPRESIVVWREASSSYGFQQFVTPQELSNVTTNVSAAYRGDRIFIQGRLSSAQQVNVSGTVMQVRNRTFQGWIQVPHKAATGKQQLRLRVLTDAGNVFHATIPLRVRNNPPQVQVSYPAKIATGDNLTVRVNATDDRNVSQLRLTFQGQTLHNRSGVFHLSTASLPKQTYSFTVSVQDSEGKSAQVQRSFEIVSRQEKKRYEQNQDGNDQNGGDSNRQQSSSIPIIGAFRELIKNFLLNLLGA
ncbi:MAG: Ig-like domain-containing protein, partial [Candidatus Nanohaloarchaea archaeon]|nr:Ig-like domain-containing protein [Candidatus Nanohaloarchaea archaeon]